MAASEILKKYSNAFLRHIDTISREETGDGLPPRVAPLCPVLLKELVVAFLSTDIVPILAFPQWSLVAKICLTVAVGTASNERSFSLLHLIVTPLRNRISQPMLDALMRIVLSGDYSIKDVEKSVQWWAYKMDAHRRITLPATMAAASASAASE